MPTKPTVAKAEAKPAARRKRGASSASEAEYTVDELARAADATVRNVRAYQDRGLLPPPEKRGRTGIYTKDHLARLRLINQLLDRGYTLGNIAELIAAWERGQNLRDLLGLESAITTPWSEELPGTFTMPDKTLREQDRRLEDKIRVNEARLELLEARLRRGEEDEKCQREKILTLKQQLVALAQGAAPQK